VRRRAERERPSRRRRRRPDPRRVRRAERRHGSLRRGRLGDRQRRGRVGEWWRKQDPTRAPRFDLAGFSCTGAGSLDISDVRLPHPTAYYNQASVPRIQQLRDDLLAAGFDDATKKYLVYYDQVQPALGSDCGAAYVNAQSGGAHGYAAVYIAPNLGGCGTIGLGGFLAVIAAHELINALGALDPATPGPPHRCPGDALHPCDSSLDVLAPRPTATTLAGAVLDSGHDDYYAHSGSWWDVQDSAWLRHLDVPQYRVRVTVGSGGEFVFAKNQPSVSCTQPSTCKWTWQAGSELTLSATAAPGLPGLRVDGVPRRQRRRLYRHGRQVAGGGRRLRAPASGHRVPHRVRARPLPADGDPPPERGASCRGGVLLRAPTRRRLVRPPGRGDMHLDGPGAVPRPPADRQRRALGQGRDPRLQALPRTRAAARRMM
jgi:hypothetical protein